MSAVTEFGATWKNSAITSKKKLERLRTFFRFAWDREWIASNPAARVRMPKGGHAPALPFSYEGRILAACDRYTDNSGPP